MIEPPPRIQASDFDKALKNRENALFNSLIDKINDKYEYWSEVKYKKLPEKITREELWSGVKLSRLFLRQIVWNKYNVTVSITNQMQRICHQLDMDFGGSWGTNVLGMEENKEQYLISSLMEEAISSSQMEGAATTRQVAKDMLRKEITPRNKSQQMIVNNYRTIQYIVENKKQPLTEELLLKIHSLMTTKTLDNPVDEGRFRTDNRVVVENGITHETIHTPPSYTDIPEFVETLCHFFNEENPTTFIHPIIRGIIIHFMLAYVHPFADGNGRTARALFYLYMLKQNYWLMQYLSISRIIADTKDSYEKAFQYAEADENDIGYFIYYNLRVLNVAFKKLQTYIQFKHQRLKASSFFKLGDINERQADILMIIKKHPQTMLTIKEIQNRYSISHPTAKNDIDKLVAKKLLSEIHLNKVKSGYRKGDNFDELTKSIE